jgi:hypothetical protein
MLIPIDPQDAASQVERDVVAVLGESLPADSEGGYAPGPPFTVGLPVAGANDGDPIELRPLHDSEQLIHAVPWSWTGVDRRGLFELGPTDERVTLRGVTFVTRVRAEADDETGGYQLYRCVDWLDAFAQAGVSIATRPVYDTRRAIGEDELRGIPQLDEAYRVVEERGVPEG